MKNLDLQKITQQQQIMYTQCLPPMAMNLSIWFIPSKFIQQKQILILNEIIKEQPITTTSG